MKKRTLLFLLVLSLVLVTNGFATSLAPAPIAATSASNEVHVAFLTTVSHFISGDSFANGEVIGGANWHTRIVNSPDETGAPVTGLGVTLTTELEFEYVDKQYLTRMGPPTYEWSFGDAREEGSLLLAWTPDATVGFMSGDRFPFKFTPGFDASRSADKTVFTGPDTQILTITMTPREEVEKLRGLEVVVHTISPGKENVEDAVITPISPTSGEHIELSPNGHDLGIRQIPLELKTPWSITLTIQVTPRVSEVEYMPFIALIWSGPPKGASSGTGRGSSISYTNEAGTWAVSADGNYIWNWIAGSPGYSVGFHPRANIPPTLTSGKVSLTSDTPRMPFTFEITYEDADGDPASYVRVYVDGSPYDMGWVSGDDYRDGMRFTYPTTLGGGQHSYYFEASDGSMTARFPEEGTLSGPFVEVPRFKFPIWTVVGIVVIGLIIYFSLRSRRRQAAL